MDLVIYTKLSYVERGSWYRERDKITKEDYLCANFLV